VVQSNHAPDDEIADLSIQLQRHRANARRFRIARDYLDKHPEKSGGARIAWFGLRTSKRGSRRPRPLGPITTITSRDAGSDAHPRKFARVNVSRKLDAHGVLVSPKSESSPLTTASRGRKRRVNPWNLLRGHHCAELA